MRAPPDERRAPLAGDEGALQETIALGSDDKTEDKPEIPEDQASHRRRAGFARAITFSEFGYRAGRAIDYGDFVDRRPNQLSRWATSASWWRARP